jgi:hypothetical protein
MKAPGILLLPPQHLAPTYKHALLAAETVADAAADSVLAAVLQHQQWQLPQTAHSSSLLVQMPHHLSPTI